ncbi:MAG: ribosome biogenesis GTPase Der [Planctomycetia bacterium]|nr:ribosome biogenesis GTPase Der [Planctomycetia bacterium]
MRIPQVVITGRPNVGKSSLFNWLAGRRLAIVDDMAGVTRDRVTHLIALDDRRRRRGREDLGGTGEIADRYIELTDTGGIGIVDRDDLSDEVERQIQIAIDSADLVLFVTDCRSGAAPLDNEVARRLRGLQIPVLVVVNKADTLKMEDNAHEFARFGWPVVAVSTLQNRNQGDLATAILDLLPEDTSRVELDEDGKPVLPVTEPEMKIAIVGCRNVGKSTFINTLTKQERMIVSPVPGTTRDSVDVRFELDGKPFIAIDTPGLQRRRNIDTNLDFYESHRAKRSIRRADVVLHFFDASREITTTDKQLATLVAEEHRPCIFVVNKWDLYQGKVMTGEWADYLRDTFRTMTHVPIVFITGQSGKNMKRLLNHAQHLFRQSRTRISTSKLNRIVRAALEYQAPPMYQSSRRPKVFYATQVAVEPPTIVLICNIPKAFTDSYRRYLIGFLRDHLPFSEVPIRLVLRQREETDTRDDVERVITATPQYRTATGEPTVEPIDEEPGSGTVFREEEEDGTVE